MIRPSKLNERGAAKEIRKKVNELLAYCNSLQIMDSPTVKAKRMSMGTVLQSAPPGSTEVEAGSVQRFKVTSVADNWLVCRKMKEDDTEESATDYKVMRPIMTRKDKALPSGASSGSLSYPADQQRAFTIMNASPSKTITVKQTLFPKYMAGDFIYGIKPITGGTVDDGAGVQLDWIDMNIDARKWVLDLKLVAVCVNNNVTQFALARITDPVA